MSETNENVVETNGATATLEAAPKAERKKYPFMNRRVAESTYRYQPHGRHFIIRLAPDLMEHLAKKRAVWALHEIDPNETDVSKYGDLLEACKSMAQAKLRAEVWAQELGPLTPPVLETPAATEAPALPPEVQAILDEAQAEAQANAQEAQAQEDVPPEILTVPDLDAIEPTPPVEEELPTETIDQAAEEYSEQILPGAEDLEPQPEPVVEEETPVESNGHGKKKRKKR